MMHIKGANSTITGLTLDGNRTARLLFLDGPGVVADTIEVKNFTQIGIGVRGGGGQIDIGNAYTTNTTAIISGNES